MYPRLLAQAQYTCAVQAVNEDGKLAWSRVTVFKSFWTQLPDTPFLRMTTAAGQVCVAQTLFSTMDACQHIYMQLPLWRC